MAVVATALPVEFSPPTYTITIQGGQPYSFVFDPVRYAPVDRVQKFLDCLRAGKPGCIHINVSHDMWSDSQVLRVGNKVLVKTEKILQEFVTMVECALLRARNSGAPLTVVEIVSASPFDNRIYPHFGTSGDSIYIQLAENVTYTVSRAVVSDHVDETCRALHLVKLKECHSGALVIMLGDVRLRFEVTSADSVQIILSDQTKMHSITRTAARACEVVSRLYELAPVVNG